MNKTTNNNMNSSKSNIPRLSTRAREWLFGSESVFKKLRKWLATTLGKIFAFIVTSLVILEIINVSFELCDRFNWNWCNKQPPEVQTSEQPPVIKTTAQLANELFAGNPTDLRIETLLKTLPRTSFRIGEKMTMRFNSDHDGYIFVFDLNPKGGLVTLFPNQYSQPQQGYIKAGHTLTIPDVFWDFEFPVKKPIGRGMLLAILVVDEQEDELAMGYNILPVVGQSIPTEYATNLLQILRLQLDNMIMFDESGNERHIQWFSNVADYEIMH